MDYVTAKVDLKHKEKVMVFAVYNQRPENLPASIWDKIT